MTFTGESERKRLTRLLNKRKAERSLLEFIRKGWCFAGEAGEFEQSWHIECLCDHYEAVCRGDIRRLVVNLPPRHMKSLGGSVFMPAWNWAQNPDPEKKGHGFFVRPGTKFGAGARFGFVSYQQELSNEFSRKCRLLIESEWFRLNWADRFTLSGDANRIQHYATDKGGDRRAMSVNGITGFGFDIIVLDDPHDLTKVESDVERNRMLKLWDEVLPWRLNDIKSGAIVVVMQRSHTDDLSGHILAQELKAEIVSNDSRNKTYFVCLPARFEPDHPVPLSSPLPRWVKDPRSEGEPLWANRFPLEALSRAESRMTQFAVAGQMQQRPVPRGGGMFKREWFANKIIGSPDCRIGAVPAGTQFVRHWDLAGTAKKSAAYTVGLKLGKMPDGNFVVAHVVRAQIEGPEVRRLIQTTTATDSDAVEISLPKDVGQAGKVQAGDMVRMLAGYSVHAEAETGSKETRAEPVAAQAANGNLYLVQGAWNDAFLDELEVFPNGKWKDQVDALSGAFGRLNARKGEFSQGMVEGLY